MKVTINKSTPSGNITAPPSKSMAHRLLICAALATGTSRVNNIAMSEDVKATIRALSALGVKINTVGNDLIVEGGFNVKDRTVIDCNESGSLLRFIIPVCLLTDKEITLTGTKRLFARSLSVYEKMCDERGYYYHATEDSVTVKGKLQSGVYHVRGDISSQFISGLIFALPCVLGDSVIEIEGTLESAPYIDLTVSALKKFGVDIIREDNKIYIKGNSTYKSSDCIVEGDCSNAAFYEALNTVGGNVTVDGIDADTLQGDRVYKQYFDILKEKNATLDISDCPDLGPILMAVGAVYNGVHLTGTHRLKIKESDRGAVMGAELAKFGVSVQNGENDIIVSGGISEPKDVLFGHNDHRIVMSLATLCVKTGGVIEGAEAVQKSLPDYFEKLVSLGAEVIYEA